MAESLAGLTLSPVQTLNCLILIEFNNDAMKVPSLARRLFCLLSLFVHLLACFHCCLK